MDVQHRKFVVPEGMIDAFWEEYSGGYRGPESHRRTMDGLKAVLRWQSDNPRIPTDEQIEEMKAKLVSTHPHWANIVAEWQRRMYIAPENEFPKELKEAICDGSISSFPASRKEYDDSLVEAYNRGRKAVKQK